MYGQQGVWQPSPQSWHSTNGYPGQQQQHMQLHPQQSNRQQHPYEEMQHLHHPPPPSRHQYQPHSHMQHQHPQQQQLVQPHPQNDMLHHPYEQMQHPYQLPPPNRHQYQPPSHMLQHQPLANGSQVQHPHVLQQRGHTPNSRPHKRFRQDTAGTARMLSLAMQPLPPTQPRSLTMQQPVSLPPWHMQQQQPPGAAPWIQQSHPRPGPPQDMQQLPQHHPQQLPQPRLQVQPEQQPLQDMPPPQQQGSFPADADYLTEVATEAAAAPEYPSSNHGNPAAAAWLDRLQEQILRFVQQVAPTPAEELQRHSSLKSISTLVQQALPQHVREMRVALFGSGAAGLAVHHSDLDVAVIGLASPGSDSGTFDDASKQFVVKCLKCIERKATYGPSRNLLDVTSSRLVARARVPVLKLQLFCGLELDVSLNDDSGVKAARFLTSFQSDYPAVRPLILVLKAALKQRGLADVATGGLGSWSLANMVIAHVMEEDRAGYQADHVGSMLLSFLQRFGVDFHLDRQAVAVKRGGIIAKQLLGHSFSKKEGQLALEDPLTGREVAGGSHRYADVEAVFTRLHKRLAADLAHHHQGGTNVADSSNGNSTHVRFGSDSNGLEGLDDDNDDGDVYISGNRSPTYKAKMRRSKQQGQPESEFRLLGMVMDCEAALARNDGSVAAAGTMVNGAGRGGGGRWQWGNGAGGRGPAPVVGSKREHW